MPPLKITAGAHPRDTIRTLLAKPNWSAADRDIVLRAVAALVLRLFDRSANPTG